MSAGAAKASDKDLNGQLRKLKDANIFSVRARIYQRIANICRTPDSTERLDFSFADECLTCITNDLAILSHQSSASPSEWEAFLTVAYFCLKVVKDKFGDRCVKLLAAFSACECETSAVANVLVQCCIMLLRYHQRLKADTKKQFTDFLSKLAVWKLENASNELFEDVLVLFGLLLHEDENVQTVVVGFIKALKILLATFSKEQKTDLLKSVDKEEFRNQMRNLSRSPSLHHLVSDVLLVIIPQCGEVLHTATLANIVLAWATYLAKSLIHDAALSFFTVWTALIDNFAETKTIILSSRHRKLVLSGFGPSLTNAKLRTPELLGAKINAWWHFIVQSTRADPKFLANGENFAQTVAPLIAIITGDVLSIKITQSSSSSSVLPTSLQQSEYGKFIASSQGKANTDLVALSCDILLILLVSSLGNNSFEKLETWLKTKHQAVQWSDLFVEPVAKFTSFGLDASAIAPSILSTVTAIFEEVAKSSASENVVDSSEAVAAAQPSITLGNAAVRLFSALLFWLASSIECSQNMGALHWRQLSSLLKSLSLLPVEPSSIAGLNVAFIVELPSGVYLGDNETVCDELSLNLLTTMVDSISKSSNSVSAATKKGNLSNMSVVNFSDPSPAVSCAELALMKLLSLLRKSAAMLTAHQSNWKLLETVCSLACRQTPLPPAFIVYCWVHNWQRLAEIAEAWLSNDLNAFELATFTSFLALPFKLLRICPVANGPTCCRIVRSTEGQSKSVKTAACKCSACRRLLDKEFLTTLASKWRQLFDRFCNAPDTDTPRLTRGSGSVTKICTKLLKCLKPTQPSGALPLPFLTFASLCFESIRERALATTNLSVTRRTSRAISQPPPSETTTVFVRCITATFKEGAETLSAVLVFADHIHQQCKKGSSMTTAPIGFTTSSLVKSCINCLESLSTHIGDSSINEYSSIANTLIPTAAQLLGSVVKIVESAESSICLSQTDSAEFSKTAICDLISDAIKRILSNLNKFTDVKNALLSSSATAAEGNNADASKDTNMSHAFSELVNLFNNCKITELKQLAREITRDLWPAGSLEKHTFGTELLQACALMPESQVVDSSQTSSQTTETTSRTRAKRSSLAVRKDDQQHPSKMSTSEHKASSSTLFGSLLTSPVKTRNHSPTDKIGISPLFSPPTRAPNTISTTGRGRASTGSTSIGTKRPSSVLGKSMAIDMEQSCEFVIVEASQDPIESAKKRRLKATEHQIEVMKSRKSDIPRMFNTLDAESQQSASLQITEKESSSSAAIVDNAKEEKTSKKKLAASKKFVPLIERMAPPFPTHKNEQKDEPIVIEDSQESQKIDPSNSTKITSPQTRILSPVNTIEADEAASAKVDSVPQDSSSMDTFSSEVTVLQMDITVMSEVNSDTDAEEVESATMMLLADSEDMLPLLNPSESGTTRSSSPDVVESSLETTLEVNELPSSLPEEGQHVNVTNTTTSSSSPKKDEPISDSISENDTLLSSSPPPREVKVTSLDIMEVSTVTTSGNGSPLQQCTTSAAMAILRSTRVTPSSPGILKRPSSTNSACIVDTPSPARKNRHVSFSAKTYVKEISPINVSSAHESVFSSWRNSRNQQHQHEQNSTPMAPPQSMPPPPPPETSAAKAEPNFTSNNSPRTTTQENASAAALNDSKAIYPSLSNCARPIGEILPQIAPTVQFQHGLLALLRAGGVRTIGDIAKLGMAEVRRLPIRTPQVEVLKAALVDFEKKMGYQREGISRMQMLLGGRSAIATGDVACPAPRSDASDTNSTRSAETSATTVEPIPTKATTAPTIAVVRNEATTSDENMIVDSSQPCEVVQVVSTSECRSVKTDMAGVEVDVGYECCHKRNEPTPNTSTVETGIQTDEYSLAIASIIDQLHAITAKTDSINQFTADNCEFIAAYSRWCQKAVCPK